MRMLHNNKTVDAPPRTSNSGKTLYGGLTACKPHMFNDCENLISRENLINLEACADIENIRPGGPETPTERLGLRS